MELCRKQSVMLVSLLLLLLTSIPIQPGFDGDDVLKYGGHAYMYEFADYPAVPAPEGYKAFHISHYGRHGARYNTEASCYDRVMDCLNAGKDSLGLTDLGKDLYKRYTVVYPLLKGHNGDLSNPGRWQQRMLADRMIDNYPEIFCGEPHIEASASIVHRVIVSMATFCCEIQRRISSAEIEMRSDYPEMSICNPISDLNPYFNMGSSFQYCFEDGLDLYNRVQDFQKGKMHPEAFLSRIFTDERKAAEAFGDVYEVETSFFRTAVHMQCLDIDEDFLDMFDESELRGCFEGENLMQYVFHGSGVFCHDVYPSLTASLLEDLIQDGENAVNGAGPTVRLRFGHDSVLASLLPLMRLNGFDVQEPDFDKVADVWQLWQVPMASNLQIVYFRNDDGDVLVRILYNEKDAKTPLPQDLYPFYRWEDFKIYYNSVVTEAKQVLKDNSK